MSVPRCSYLTNLILIVAACGTLSAQVQMAPSGVEAAEPVSLHPKEVYPQIVRLSLVQGDVRVALGRQKGQGNVPPWVDGRVNLPLESESSIVTGKGRVEIEFEDASTMYLGENSVLAFNDLTTQNGVPNTDMVLMTGVATLHLRPTMPGEQYVLRTETDAVRIPYGSHSNVRVNSYTDAITVTPQSFTEVHFNDAAPVPGTIGRTFTYSNGVFVPTAVTPTNNFAEWDQWVAARVAARNMAMHAVMKDSGLREPLPGMADMEAKGSFFDCQPYGTCWAPTKGWGKPQAAAQQTGAATQAQAPPMIEGSQQAAAPQQAQSSKLATQAQQDEEQAEQQTGGGGVAPALWAEDDYDFPCSPYSIDDWMTGDPAFLTSDIAWNGDGFGGFGYGWGYDWAVCHAGSWIRWRHRYVWVAGRHHHHHSPVRWVKVAGKVGYVPIHPHDVEGKEPVNLKHGIFVSADRKGGGVERVAYDPGARVKFLAEAPKGFREPTLPALRATSAPTLEAHPLLAGRSGSKAGAPSMIAFDPRAKGFTVTTHEAGGGRASVSHFSSGGGGFGGGGGRGYGGGGSSGGGGRGYGGGGSSGGGGRGSSGGGSSAGGGGGSHSSGGGSMSSGSSAGSGSSGGGAAGGGAHGH
jgi:hypothetical protein